MLLSNWTHYLHQIANKYCKLQSTASVVKGLILQAFRLKNKPRSSNSITQQTITANFMQHTCIRIKSLNVAAESQLISNSVGIATITTNLLRSNTLVDINFVNKILMDCQNTFKFT